MEFYQSYHPITATPFICNDQYMEFQPCSALKPYIKCFWGTKKPAKQSKTNIPTERIITPDTCMDIIFEVDYSSNKIASIFCGIDDHTFCTHNDNREEKVYSTFAIRFYAWSAMLFSEESMCDTRNGRFDAVRHFPKITREIEPLLFDIADMDGFITIAEQVLLKNFCERHKNRLPKFLGAKGICGQNSLQKNSISAAGNCSDCSRNMLVFRPRSFPPWSDTNIYGMILCVPLDSMYQMPCIGMAIQINPICFTNLRNFIL